MKLIFVIMLSFFVPTKVVFAMSQPMSITEFFNKANYENMESICNQFYDANIQFIDPLGEINGIQAMVSYYKNMYKNVKSIRFDPKNEFTKGEEKVFVWQMHLEHKSLGGGKPIVLDGVSVFRYKNGKAVYHRDYFDLGAMIYEKVPVLGSVIRWIKDTAHGNP